MPKNNAVKDTKTKPAKVFSIGNVASDLAKDIMERVEGVEAKANFDLREIPLEEIAYHPENRYGMRNLEELAESLKLHGQKHNAVVRPFTALDNPKIKYQLISGERRHRALVMIGARTIFSKVEEMDDLKALELIDVINLQTRELSEMERAEAVARLFKIVEQHKDQGVDYGGVKTREIVAGIMSSETEKFNPATVAQYKKLNDLISVFKVLVDSGDISRELGYQYAQLPEEQQKLIYAAFEQGKELTAKEAKNLKDELQKKDVDHQQVIETFKAQIRLKEDEAQDTAEKLEKITKEKAVAERELDSSKEMLRTLTKEKEALSKKANSDIEAIREQIRTEVEKQAEEQNASKLKELQDNLDLLEKQKAADVKVYKEKADKLQKELKKKEDALKEKEIKKNVTEGNKAIQSLARQAQKALDVLREEIDAYEKREGFELTDDTKAVLAEVKKYEGKVSKKR